MIIPFLIRSESRRTDEERALARLEGATTYPIEMETELPRPARDAAHQIPQIPKLARVIG